MLGRWSRTLSADAGLSLQLYYDRTHLSIPVPAQVLSGLTLAPAGTLTDDLDTYDVDFHHRFLARQHHHLTWGLDYRFTHDEVGNAPALSFIPPTLNQHLFSAFAQDEIALSKTVAFTAGTKLFASETVIADEIGSRAQVGETMSISTSAYDNRYDDLRSSSLSAPDPVLHLPFPLFFENNLDGHTYASSSA